MTRDADGELTPTTLGEACEINPKKPRLTDLPEDTTVMFVPMAAVDEVSGTVAAPQQRTLGDVRGKSYRTFAPGDVLFAKITPCMENGKSAVVPHIASGLGFGSTEFHVLRPKPGVSAQFIWHFLRREGFRREAEEHMTGSVGQARVPRAFLEDFPIALPDEGTQREIAKILDATIDSGRSATRHVAAAKRTVDRFRQAVLAAACTGRLTLDWRVANPREVVPDPPKLSDQAAANLSGAPNASDLAEIPATWAWWPIESITERVIDYRGRTPPSEATGTIPHVRTVQIRNGRIDWQTDRFVTRPVYDEYMTRGMPQRGDLLFTMEAPLGEVGLVDRDEPFSIAQRILLLRPGEGLTGEFLSLAMRSHPVRRAIEYRSTGSGVVGIAYKRLRSVLIPKPPPDEQAEIMRRASELIALADSVSARIDATGGRMRRISQSTFAKAFRGDLRLEGATPG